MPNLAVNVKQQADKPLVESVRAILDGPQVKLLCARLTRGAIDVLGCRLDKESGGREVALYTHDENDRTRLVYADINIRGIDWPRYETAIVANITHDYLNAGDKDCFIILWHTRATDYTNLLWSRASDGVVEEEVR